ncbi:MAG TPA: hypothetical protein VFG92_00190 [Agromyces sp.]|nr:hypothetical protein [Agromyces sp.]
MSDPATPKSVSRRTLVKAAAWTVPVIAVAVPAPAYAASPSPCTPTTSFDNLKPGSSPSSITFLPSMVTATLVYSSHGQSGNRPGDTGRVAATNTTPSWNYIELEMVSRLDEGDYVQLTITLSEPVTGLSFVLHDIDATSGGWRDTVRVMTGGYTFDLGGNLQGSGTDGDRFRPINNGDTPIESGLGDVRLTWPGQAQVVTIRYIAGITGNSGNQHIGLGDLSYDACVVLPANAMSARSMSSTRAPVPLSTGEPSFVQSDESVDS